MSIQNQEIGFDPDALRLKYKAERDKRVRADGNDQYQEVEGDFAYFVDDPYIDKTLQRGPVEDEIEVAIIGGGFGGMLAAARLREAGIDDFRVIEKGGDFGGTWYWNRYPALRATSSLTSISPCWKKPSLPRSRNIPMRRKHLIIVV